MLILILIFSLFSKSSHLHHAVLWLTHRRRGRKAHKYGQSFLNLNFNFSHYTVYASQSELRSHHGDHARRRKKDWWKEKEKRKKGRESWMEKMAPCYIFPLGWYLDYSSRWFLLEVKFWATFICVFSFQRTKGESRRFPHTQMFTSPTKLNSLGGQTQHGCCSAPSPSHSPSLNALGWCSLTCSRPSAVLQPPLVLRPGRDNHD